MSLRDMLGAIAQATINTGVRVLGKSICPEDHPWLKCPVGLPGAVGTQMYSDIAAAENLEQRRSKTAGLLASFAGLSSDHFDSSRIDPRIRPRWQRSDRYILIVHALEVQRDAHPLPGRVLPARIEFQGCHGMVLGRSVAVAETLC